MITTALHTFDGDAESVLASMALSSEVLQEICRRGLSQYFTATPFHPNNAPGTFLYQELVRSKRELLVPKGWQPAEEGLCLTYNEDLALAIAVSSGDNHVGDLAKHPSFKYPKGPSTQAAVSGNAVQLGLFDTVSGAVERLLQATRKKVDFGSYSTWWLLTYVDLPKQVMRAELSLPASISSSGDVTQWQVRIVLDPVPFDEGVDFSSSLGVSDSLDFDVEVRKKA